MGVKKGDRVCLYMQMIPQLPVAMLACARIGAVHTVVFAAFSAPRLAAGSASSTPSAGVLDHGQDDRDAGQGERHSLEGDRRPGPSRGSTRCTPVLEKARRRQEHRQRGPHACRAGTSGWDEEMNEASGPTCEPRSGWPPKTPLFILYTSGSTGKPKGVMHTTGGYLVYTALSHRHEHLRLSRSRRRLLLRSRRGVDHRALVTSSTGPLANGATSVLMFEVRAHLSGRRVATGRSSDDLGKCHTALHRRQRP